MAPAGNRIDNLLTACIKNRSHNRYIWQMRTPVIRVIHHKYITRFDRAFVQTQYGAHAFRHGAEMHRDMRRIGHKIASLIKQCAGKIITLFNIHRISRIGQGRAHLISD